MPKEQIRKRGRRKPKHEAEPDLPAPLPPPQPEQAGPSGVHPARAALISGRPASASSATRAKPVVEEEQRLKWQRGPRTDSEYPFGVLDPDLKAYFRNVEERIRDWEGVPSAGEEREDRQLFLNSVLSELRGSELQVATDPDCAVVLERLLPSLGDWGRRVIGDAFGDGWEQVIRHRFGSHVVQAWFSLAADTLDREAKGVYPSRNHAQASSSTDTGILPTMTTLISGIITSLLPTLPALVVEPHASPPTRILLLVLTPGRPLPSPEGKTSTGDLIRSKKSNKFRKGHGVQGKSIFGDEDGKGKATVVERVVPEELSSARKTIRTELMERLSGAEWRVMGVDAVGSAAVQLLLELEVEEGEAEREGSLLDHLTEGLAHHNQTSTTSPPQPQPYLTSLLTTLTGTHLLEAILIHSPKSVFEAIWSAYFQVNIGELATHPFANFVVARGVSRLDAAGVEGVVEECNSLSGGRGLITTARTSVLQALVDRAGVLGDCQNAVLDLIISALDLPETDQIALVPCLMVLKTFPTYQALITGTSPPVQPADALDPDAEAAARMEGWKNRRQPKRDSGGLTPNMQGCLLLQALVKLPSTNEVLDSLLAQEVSTLLEYAKHSIASHFLDAALTSPSVPLRYRRQLISTFLGHYAELAQDRVGSRVADTIWAAADGYMREKIARTLIPEATILGNSEYGRFFVRKLDLWGLERRPEEWRDAQLGVKARPGRTSARAINGHQDSEEGMKEKEKRKEMGDEIDELFAGVEKKRRKV